MSEHIYPVSRRGPLSCRVHRKLVPLACVLATGIGLTLSCAAAEIEMTGSAAFRPLSVDRLAMVPQGSVFSKDDLSSGALSFNMRYEDSTPDSDPDPYVGHYGGAIRSLQLTVGSTTIALPPENAELVVSDGGLGFPERESVKVKAWIATPSGVLRFSWIQNNQALNHMDLRGVSGSLTSDALPQPSVIANLATSSRFDKFVVLELSVPASTQPVLYLSSSQVRVAAKPTAN